VKKTLIVAIMVAVTAALLSSCAAASIRVKAGYWMPNEELKGYGVTVPESGLTYGAEMTTALPGDIMELGLGAQYFNSEVKVGDDALTWEVIPVQGTAYFDLGSAYLGAGVGYYFFTFKENGDSASESELGYHGVLGFNLTDMIFLEGRYATCTIDEVDVGGISALLGISF